MGKTDIAWTDETWNPIRGCTRISLGCKNCYAERLSARGLPGLNSPTTGKPFAVMTPSGPHWKEPVELIESKLLEPLSWRKPKRVFVNSMSDLFHEDLPDEAIDRVFAVMALTPHITYQVLTKRAIRMVNYLCSPGSLLRFNEIRDRGALMNRGVQPECSWPLPNVWLGVSVENQPTADARIPLLLQTPAAKRFVSYEPALAGVYFRSIPRCLDDNEPSEEQLAGPRGCYYVRHGAPGIDWIIVGGESGPGARPFNPEWARLTVVQCRSVGVACFVKQMGSRPFTFASYELQDLHLKDRSGADPSEWPEELRVREFPA